MDSTLLQLLSIILICSTRNQSISYYCLTDLQLLKNMKRQFCGLLYDTGFVHSPDPNHDEANCNSSNTKLLKAVLCAGLYPNVAKIVQTNPDRY